MRTIRFLLFLLAVSARVSFSAPTITSVLNAYSYTPPSSPNYGIAQGSIFVILGTELATTTTTLQHVPLTARLGGILVQIGTPKSENIVPLYSVSPTRIVGILPSDTPVGLASLTVYGDGRQTTIEFKVEQSAFGIMTLDGSGIGPAAAYDAQSNVLNASNSAKPGAVIEIFGAGVGPTTGDEYVEQAQINLTNIPMIAEIGGVQAEILYRGRTIYPGLDQINIRIPNLSSNVFSCSVPLVIKSGGISSNVATIPVAQDGGACQDPVTITQAEIDRWSAAGSYTTGSIWLRRSSSAGSGTILMTSDGLSATFNRLTGPDVARSLRNDAGTAVPTAGQCTVGGNANPYPNIAYADLDAGAFLTSEGPNGAVALPKGVDEFGAGYFSDSLHAYLAAGRYTLSGRGGADGGRFSGTLDVGLELIWTNWKEAQAVTRSNGLAIRWTGGDSTQLLYIYGVSLNQRVGSSFFCYADIPAGQFTVPASILNQIPASGPQGPGIPRSYIYISTTGGGARLQASGVDYFTASYSWSTSTLTDFR